MDYHIPVKPFDSRLPLHSTRFHPMARQCHSSLSNANGNSENTHPALLGQIKGLLQVLRTERKAKDLFLISMLQLLARMINADRFISTFNDSKGAEIICPYLKHYEVTVRRETLNLIVVICGEGE